MCGIAGIWYGGNVEHNTATMTQMLNTLIHRGPDGYGMTQVNDGALVLGHQRLAIIDLSPAAAQPMQNEDGQFVITFSGEVYNFYALRQELSISGVQFRSNSDTEVVLKGYERWGVKVLDKLVGMFAFAIWDAKRQQLFLARDRTGEKPLYYFQGQACFGFASELKAIKYLPGFSAKINQEAIALYLMLCNVPAPLTIFEQVHKLPPAHAMLVSKEKTEIWRYWDALRIVQEPRLNLTMLEAEQHLEGLLHQAVSKQMVADVPLGLFLSGGVDSSLVLSFMAELTDQKVKTFTVGFDSPLDEAPHAAAIAKYFGTHHTTEYISPQEVLALVPHIPSMFGEPFADPTALANYFVAKNARKDVSVCLAGDGGDELFGGYSSWHQNYENIKRFNLDLPCLAALRPILAILPKRYGRASMLLGRPLPETFLSFMSFYLGDEIQQMTGINPSYPAYEQVWDKDLSLTDHRRCLTATFLTYLSDFILTKVDRSSMAVSLESRAPLLDHRIIEFSLRLPEPFVKEKQLLKNILYKRAPRHLFNRPKQGFALLPLEHWLRNELKEPLHEALCATRLAKVGIESTYVKQLLKEHSEETRNHQRRLWALWVLSNWVESF